MTPRLLAHQSLVLVPGAFASRYNKKCSLECYDAFCMRDAIEFLQWALDDNRVAAITPYHWHTCPHCHNTRVRVCLHASADPALAACFVEAEGLSLVTGAQLGCLSSGVEGGTGPHPSPPCYSISEHGRASYLAQNEIGVIGMNSTRAMWRLIGRQIVKSSAMLTHLPADDQVCHPSRLRARTSASVRG